jgi:hypothetical protein
MILRCTKKLLEAIRPEQLATKDADGEDWYANLLFFDRRKCLVLTHTDTLFTIFEPDVAASDLRSTHELVAELIERALLAEGLPLRTFGNLGIEDLLIANTADRSVLGCMNDMAYLCEDAVARAGSLTSTDVRSLNRRLRRNINRARDYQRPIDLVMERNAQ